MKRSWLPERQEPRQPPAAHEQWKRRRGAAAADWTRNYDGAVDMVGLIPDDVIVSSILSRLDLTSLVRAAAVSKTWRVLCRQIHLPAAGIPWLLACTLPHFTPSLLNLNNHPIPSATPIRLPSHLPRPPSASVMPVSFRYVGVVDGNAIITPEVFCNTALALYNPFSGETRRLVPSANSTPVYKLRFRKVRVMPELGLVVATRGNHCHLYTYLIRHSDHWVFSNLPRVSDFIFYRGNLYCIGFDGCIYTFCVKDLLTDAINTRPKKVYNASTDQPSSNDSSHHLVESGGDLLLFTWNGQEFNCVLGRMEFNKQGEVSLVPVKDLGDRLLLVNLFGGSISCPVPANPTSDLFSKNCVYFIHRMNSLAKLILNGGKKVSFIVYPPIVPFLYNSPVWIIPSLRSIWSD